MEANLSSAAKDCWTAGGNGECCEKSYSGRQVAWPAGQVKSSSETMRPPSKAKHIVYSIFRHYLTQKLLPEYTKQ